MVNPKLNNVQIAALKALAADPAATVPPSTLSKLRKLGHVGRRVEKPTKENGYKQRTTSPVLPSGYALLQEGP